MQAILSNIQVLVLTSMVALLLGCKDSKPDKASSAVTVDAVIPLTGVAAEYGSYYREALSSFRASKRLENSWNLSVLDSKSNPKDAIAAVQVGVKSGEQPRIVFAELSSVCMAIAPFVEEQESLLVAVAATPKLASYKNVLRIYPEANALAKQFKRAIALLDKNALEIGIFYINDDFGASVSDALERILPENGMRTAFRRPIPNATDAPSEVDRLRSGKVDLIVVIGLGQPMGTLIRNIRERLPDATILASPEFPFSSVTGQIPKQLITKVSYLAFPEIPDSEAKPLRTALGREINPLDVLVFDAAEVIRQALEGANAGTTGASLSTKIRGQVFQSLGRTIRIDAQGNIEYELTLSPAQNAYPQGAE